MNIMKEEFREVHDFPGYFISNTGRVFHYDKELKASEYNKYGHSQFRMYRDGKQYARGVHRMVAEEFIPNPDNLTIVRHLDDNPRNNHVDNLAWGTRKDNAQDSIRNGSFVFNYHTFTRDEIERSNETNRTPVVAINLKTGDQFTFKSQAEAARQLNLSQGNIGMVLTGRRNHTGGYYFEYADKEVESY